MQWSSLRKNTVSERGPKGTRRMQVEKTAKRFLPKRDLTNYQFRCQAKNTPGIQIPVLAVSASPTKNALRLQLRQQNPRGPTGAVCQEAHKAILRRPLEDQIRPPSHRAPQHQEPLLAKRPVGPGGPTWQGRKNTNKKWGFRDTPYDSTNGLRFFAFCERTMRRCW